MSLPKMTAQQSLIRGSSFLPPERARSSSTITPANIATPCRLAIGEAILKCGGGIVATILTGGHPAAIVGTSAVCLSSLSAVYRICELAPPPALEQGTEMVPLLARQ